MEGTLDLPLVEGPVEPRPFHDEQPEVTLRGKIRRQGGDWIITLFLVNGQTKPQTKRDEAWLFQAEFVVEGPEGRAVFCRRPYGLSEKLHARTRG